ncbi:MAG: NAD(P)-dependent glycerol-3-phosphate dehydrogenase [Ottowia sp.]|nr:NAD(P)-dependent glycerol-3-phosphate dehydrogenase [Ottowia sp.]
MHVAVLGAGAWGTAVAAHIARRHAVTLWARDGALVNTINIHRENPTYLPGITLPQALTASTDLARLLTDTHTDLTVIATPLSALAQICQSISTYSTAPRPLIWLCKGVEPHNHALPHEIAARELVNYPHPFGILSGPSFAQEVAQGLPCALVCATHHRTLHTTVQLAFHHNNMRVYTSSDIVGVELSGAIKNILAIATGISDGLGLGLNARAALITRGLTEMTRLGLALGGKTDTFMGLAGMGDLILTATGDLSRNRKVGLALAQGNKLNDILQQLGHVAEGVYCAQAVQALAQQHHIDMPICTAVVNVLTGEASAEDMVRALLARDPKTEGPHSMQRLH